MQMVERYFRWLHGQWPAGVVETLPLVGEGGSTNLAGVRIVGDLTGVPLLKFALDSGARAVQAILAEADFRPGAGGEGVVDLAIVGGGVSGYAAAKEASKAGLRFVLIEAQDPFTTVANFPKGKPIYTYPPDLVPTGDLQVTATVKEDLLAELQRQTRDMPLQSGRVEKITRQGDLRRLDLAGDETILAQRVIVAIGRSGNFRRLGVAGEDLAKVYNRLHDPKDYAGCSVLVVGGGDSALEAAIALATAGAQVTLSYRGREFSRAKPETIASVQALAAAPPAAIAQPGATEAGSLRVMLGSIVQQIDETRVRLRDAQGEDVALANDVVFTLIGREPPLDFFRRSRLAIAGEWRAGAWTGLLVWGLFCVWLFHWKSLGFSIGGHGTFLPALNIAWLNPANWMAAIAATIGAAAEDRTSLLFTLIRSGSDPGFYYALGYCLLVVVFGIRRVRRRKTPYVRLQTITLAAIQIIPLFVLPQIILPWMGRNGWFADGHLLQPFADIFFERYDTIGEERAYWRAYGFILAWPLFVYNWFTEQPLWGWLILGSVQTFVLIPLLIRYFGKGAYCGWICSCGALAETMGDAHRQKMPHGPGWNRLNMAGQAFLAFALVLLLLRVAGWIFPGSAAARLYQALFMGIPLLNFHYFVDVLFAGIIGVAFYFHFSGRVWCRFFCPLAALMHIYARFSRFRIFADKKKCISCNVCTSVCHQGIDVMNFANKGLDMVDPQCVRCSACVQSCPTGVLSFGYRGRDGQPVYDALAASPVQIREIARVAKAAVK